jgi:hypothetical protein
MCQSPNTYRNRFKKLTFSVNRREMTLMATFTVSNGNSIQIKKVEWRIEGMRECSDRRVC